MKKKIKLDEIEIEIRGIKYTEIKEVVNCSQSKIDEAFNLLESANIIEDTIKFIVNNLDQVIHLLERLTDKNKEQLEDMEILDLVYITNEILKHNGVNIKSIYDFFTKNFREKAIQVLNEKVFMEALPEVN